MDDTPITPEPSPPSSPFAHEPEQLRLGIIHLMVWTTCAAVYFSLDGVVYGEPDRPPLYTFLALCYGLGISATWGGLLIYVARRFRGIPFPVAPGEILLTALGAITLLNIGCYVLVRLPALLAGEDGSNTPYFHFMLGRFISMLSAGIIFLIAARKTPIVRWRVFFFSCAALYVLESVLPCLGFSPASSEIVFYLFALPSLILISVVIMDIREGLRYPWTHWLGVSVNIFFAALSLTTALILTLFPNL